MLLKDKIKHFNHILNLKKKKKKAHMRMRYVVIPVKTNLETISLDN